VSVFDDVRNGVSLADAISYLKLKPSERKGDQLRFKCPYCTSGDDRALSVNLQKGFQCFASSKRGDDATALVAHCLGIKQREAADKLAAQFLTRSSPQPRQEKAQSLALDHPVIEMLGIASTLAAIQGGFDSEKERVMFPLRASDGSLICTLGLATKADQEPLLLFSEHKPVERADPDALRKLFRVV